MSWGAGDWYGMITGRLGYAWGTTLLYVKGGAAFVPVQASVLDQCAVMANGCGNWLISTSDSKTITTATLGGGLEWAFAPNWSVKAEYMFIGLGDRHVSTTCGFASLASGATVGGGQFCFDHEFPGIHTAKVGLNYRFGGAPPHIEADNSNVQGTFSPASAGLFLYRRRSTQLLSS